TVALAKVVVVVFALSTSALAQETSPGDTARFHFGPLALTPSIAITNIGVDQNVFNDPDNPKKGTTASVGPAVDWWMRAGRSRLSAQSSGQDLYSKEYENERAWNTS